MFVFHATRYCSENVLYIVPYCTYKNNINYEVIVWNLVSVGTFENYYKFSTKLQEISLKPTLQFLKEIFCSEGRASFPSSEVLKDCKVLL